MGRVARVVPGGMVFHVLNRGVGRMPLFEREADYAAFEHCLADALAALPTRLLAYCVMPNHWHLVLHPRAAGEMAAFMQRLTITHVRRWVEHRGVVGQGHVYQGRYKSFPVQVEEGPLLSVCRYVERNALRANLVKRAADWRWCSLWRRNRPDASTGGEVSERDAPPPPIPLADWPVPRPTDWARRVEQAESAKELEALRRAVVRGQPYGDDAWRDRTVARLGLQSTLRRRGRPRKDRK